MNKTTMINTKGYSAVIFCDVCQKELAIGPFPADAEDNLGPECWIINSDGERPNEHRCAKCHADKEKENIAADPSPTKEGEEERASYPHMENIKFMKAYYGHCKTYVECMPQDNGAFHIPYTNKWLTELNVKPGIDWQARRLKFEIMDWMRDSNIGPEFLETFSKWLFKK